MPHSQFCCIWYLQEEVAAERERRGDYQPAAASSNGSGNGVSSNGAESMASIMHNPLSPYRVRLDLPDLLCDEIKGP
jgi:hypothetical protein